MKKLLCILTLTMVFNLFGNQASAETLQVAVAELKVYAQPNASSEVITTLFKGDVVPVSKNSPVGFKKVLVQDGSQKKIGYVRIVDTQPRLAGSPQARNQQRQRTTARGSAATLRNRYSVGVTGGMNYQYQNSRTYTDAAGGNASIGALSGAAAQFGGFINIPLNMKYMVKGYVLLKTVSVTGSATYQLSNAAATPNTTLLTESFLAIGGLFKDYPSRTSNFWFGGGLELDHGNSGTLQFGGYPSTALSGSDLPNFILLYAAAGADFKIGGNFFVTPEIHIGGVVNALPIIIEADALVSLEYAF